MSEAPIDILLVEDNETDVFLIQEAFRKAATARVVAVVRDGEEAIEYLHRKGRYQDAQLPGLVLLDVNMPRKNGFEVLVEMKADPALKSIPVVIFTGKEQEEDIARFYLAGAASYVPKPMGFEELIVFAEAF